MMLRWLIAILLVANLIALAAIEGLFGAPPAAGPREPAHLAQQVRPEALRVSATAQAAETPVVGGPITSPAIDVQPLGASAPDAASGAGPASEAAGAAGTSGAPGASGASAAAPATAPASGASGAAPGAATPAPAAPSAGSAPTAAHAAKLDSAAPVVAAAATLAPVALVEGDKRRAAARAHARTKPHTTAPRQKTTRT
ncbi:hypothetical protein [Burkholderia plantarii]|uniref:hypothetical protein n=1 Tax=Burkholderia plantarii TaxID=41899 RepID=UPI001F5B3185|nr:hypothetical protein [Burkholderia plantarii]